MADTTSSLSLANLDPPPDLPPPATVLNIRLGPIVLRTAIENPIASEGLARTNEFLGLCAVLLYAEQHNLSQKPQASLLGVAPTTFREMRDRHGLKGLSGPALVHHILEKGVQILDSAEAERGHAWTMPGYDPLRLHDELVSVILSGNGYVDQRLMYLGSDSAASWLKFAGMAPYREMYSTMPLGQAAAATIACSGGAGLDVMALGSGSGEREVLFVQHLLDQLDQAGTPTPLHRLHLIDISHPLLTGAYQHAGQALVGRNVAIAAVQGDFARVSQDRQLMYRPVGAHRRRVVVMLGGTFANLRSEKRFVKDSLGGMSPGDLFLVDVARAPKNASEDARVRGLPADLAQAFREWLLVPLRRYGALKEDEGYTVTAERVHAVVPGSYSLDQVVRTAGDKVYAMTTVRRYDVESLAQCLEDLGWRHVQTFAFGQQGAFAQDRALLLFQKTETAQTEPETEQAQAEPAQAEPEPEVQS